MEVGDTLAPSTEQRRFSWLDTPDGGQPTNGFGSRPTADVRRSKWKALRA
jgi:hypothetical protein